MDWRLFSAVTLAGASLSMVAFGAYTLRAAGAVPRDANRFASPIAAPSLTPFDVTGDAVTVRPGRGVSFVPFAPNDARPNDARPNGATPNRATPSEAVAALAVGYPAQSGMQVTPVEEVSPALAAVLQVPQDKVARSPWRDRRHVTWRGGHHARFCTALRPCGTDRKQQVAVRHGEGHAAPKMALMLGVGF
jgi:hypothetical protein